jgi:hypothetical protein
MFKPDASADHCEYALGILTKQCQFFGPFPVSYKAQRIFTMISGGIRLKHEEVTTINQSDKLKMAVRIFLAYHFDLW